MSTTENQDYGLSEGMQHMIWASDAVRYNDEGVEYQHAEEARSDRAREETVQNNGGQNYGDLLQAAEELEDSDCEVADEALDKIYSVLDREEESLREMKDLRSGFSDAKYDGETESGPGIAFMDYDGSIEDILEYSVGVADSSVLEGRSIYDRDFTQTWCGIGESADGIVVRAENEEGEKELYSDTLLMQLLGGVEGDSKDGAGHQVVREMAQTFPEADVAKWSSTDGGIEVYDENGEVDIRFDYDREERPRVPESFRQDGEGVYEEEFDMSNFSDDAIQHAIGD